MLVFSPFTKILVKCQQATASDLQFYDIFALQKVPFFKILMMSLHVICGLAPPPQSKILATPMRHGTSDFIVLSEFRTLYSRYSVYLLQVLLIG